MWNKLKIEYDKAYVIYCKHGQRPPLLKFRRQILQGFMNKRQVIVSNSSSNSVEMKEK
jgi:hypothetical protein